MVDPAVFTEVGQSAVTRPMIPTAVTGFAFGMGLDRLAMIMYGIPGSAIAD